MLSIAPQSVEELLQTKIFLQTIMKRKIIKTKNGSAKLQNAEPFFLATIKKKFVKLAREKDILSGLCHGDGRKNKPAANKYDNWESCGIS